MSPHPAVPRCRADHRPSPMQVGCFRLAHQSADRQQPRSVREGRVQLALLSALNAERAARRAAILVTETASGEQRLVREAEVARDPLAPLLEERLRSGKSGTVEADGRQLFLNVQVPSVKAVVIGAVHISQALAPMARGLDLAVTIIDPRTAFATPERFPDVPVLAEWPDAALPRLGLDRYTALACPHPRSEDRRSGARRRAQGRVLLYRRARLQEDPCPPRRAADGRRLRRGRHRPHPCADRPRHRRRQPGGNRRRRSRRADRGRCAGTGGAAREVRPGARRGGGRRARRAFRPGRRSVRQEGHAWSRREDAARLKAAGIDTIVAVRLEPGDVDEDEAAARLAERDRRDLTCGSSAPSPAAATCLPRRPAFCSSTSDAVDRINAVDEAITVATLPAYKPVVAGEMIGTVKIIPYAVPATSLDAAVAAAPQGGALRVAPYALRRVGVVSTVLPGLKPTVVKKTLRGARRAARSGRGADRRRRRVPHDAEALTDELRGRRGRDRPDRRVRRLGGRRPARRHPERDRGGGRPRRAFRHAGRSGQPAAHRHPRRQADHRRAGLRAQPEGERLRLGAAAPPRRPAGDARRHRRRSASAGC